MITAHYKVKGMTCEHCESSVKEEVSEIAGVTGVEVSASTGILSVNSEAPIEQSVVAAAVDEAGYDLDDPSSASLEITDIGHGHGHDQGDDSCGCGCH